MWRGCPGQLKVALCSILKIRIAQYNFMYINLGTKVLPVNISVIFRQKINIMENETVIRITFHSLTGPNIEEHRSIEGTSPVLLNNIYTIIYGHRNTFSEIILFRVYNMHMYIK